MLVMGRQIAYGADDEIVTLLRCLDGEDRDGIGSECQEELRKQLNLWIALRHRADDEFLSLAEKGEADIPLYQLMHIADLLLVSLDRLVAGPAPEDVDAA